MSDEVLKREENHKTVSAGISTVDEDILMLRVDPITNGLLIKIEIDTLTPVVVDMVKRDQNHKPTVYGISNDDGVTLIPIRTDENGYLLAQF